MSKAKNTSVLNEISERTEKAREKEAPSPLNRSSRTAVSKDQRNQWQLCK